MIMIADNEVSINLNPNAMQQKRLFLDKLIINTKLCK